MAKTITLTESELKEMIINAINENISEGENEGFFNNLRAGWQAGKNGKIDYHAGDSKDAADQMINNLGYFSGWI